MFIYHNKKIIITPKNNNINVNINIKIFVRCETTNTKSLFPKFEPKVHLHHFHVRSMFGLMP